MKNTTILGAIIISVLIVGAFVFSGAKNDVPASVGNLPSQGDAQEITLGTKDFNYYPNTISVKSGQPVSLTLDDSVSGCLRSFTIKDLGFSKYSRVPSDKIEFTPTKKGTFTFACSMGMGYGKIIVE